VLAGFGAGFGTGVCCSILVVTRSPQLTHMAQPTTPSSPHRGEQLFSISGGMLAPAPTPQAARRGGCKRLVEKTLTEGRPIAAVLAGVRLATSLLQRVVVVGGRLVRRLTPPSNFLLGDASRRLDATQ